MNAPFPGTFIARVDVNALAARFEAWDTNYSASLTLQSETTVRTVRSPQAPDISDVSDGSQATYARATE